MSTLLEVKNLKSYFFTRAGLVKAVDDVSFAIAKGETLALVGESGCGKSMTALSLLRLLPEPGKVVNGEIQLLGRDMLRLPDLEMRRIRGNEISMIFQEPMTSLNPVLKIGEQIAEVLRLHEGLSEQNALDKSAELLRLVGISDPQRRLRDYPHQLSGGQRQRIMIAMALACDPQLLIADEPTTALDVTIQAQIMDLLQRLKQERQMATLLISHDLGVVAGNADRLAIMYAGKIVESGPVPMLFENPLHPYTQGLLNCIPRPGQKSALPTIPGQLPNVGENQEGCLFLDRCDRPCGPCGHQTPELQEIEPDHWVRCWRY
ncbi:peptide/nickel transport system ATP-binding protein [Malonomonas rubra DSM 5091]|uniref:Peptide/nickel transport system ATP-binding protein n=1 Tax=Malonomonas rubra DSM 5091 TaxID=1122189 RepID=A0A1M6BI47_MALRU|nr:ABC transporter ATP-binding protein [Malonomonas rubra]SHI48450.1 peptide/nickel transport system ATP-binding protein [Malonomonas rubra DSM 5091]